MGFFFSFFFFFFQDIMKHSKIKEKCVFAWVQQGFEQMQLNGIQVFQKSCFSSWSLLVWILFFFLKKALRGADFECVSWQKMYSKFQEILPLLQRLQYYWQQKSSFLKVKCLIIMFSKSSGLEWVNPSICSAQYRILLNIIIPGQTFTCLHAFSPKKWQL